jgi:signal transduction histidine kinase
VTTSFPTDTLFVFAAPDQIVQILLNVAANAIEAMPGGGHLDITAYADGDVAVLVFSNDGPHLTSEQMGHIFDPFFTTKPEGTGLGLSISHRLIEQHGGTISVENLEGERGVVYTITLPIPCISEEEVTA